ncbi:MAG: hypothetical protein KC619_30565 [Myxococcales bacterium]|nr:hypothetical protein [Myxococcales bacterium]
MAVSLACPHCAAVLPADPPGVLHCGRCGKPYTILGPDEIAKEQQKVKDEKHVLLLVGGAMFVVYVAPMLFTLIYVVVVFAIYLAVLVGALVGAGA